MKVAVIGAGIAGLAAAKTLQESGYDVAVYEKSRGLGGRMATRRMDRGPFDHGAQYFTIRKVAFAERVSEWLKTGVVIKWDARFAEVDRQETHHLVHQPDRYIGTPGMNAPAKALAEDLTVHLNTQVSTAIRNHASWSIRLEDGHAEGPYDLLILAVPHDQALDLVPDTDCIKDIPEVSMQPCWAVMASFQEPLAVPFDAAFINSGSVSWATRNSSKPGRDSTYDNWVFHAEAEWSRKHLEFPPEYVAEYLVNAFFRVTHQIPSETLMLEAHCWRYARPDTPRLDECYWNPAHRIGACGDWLQGGRVENAYLSGLELAHRILAEQTR